MLLHRDISINGKKYRAGSYISPWKVYPFFMLHMLMFGASGFLMAYFSDGPVVFIYLHGGIAIAVYLLFYLAIFGRDRVKWMLINAVLGLFGIFGEIGALLSLAGKDIGDYPVYVHFIPFMYYVLYTFLIRQLFIEISGSRDDDRRSERVSYVYVAVSLGLSFLSFSVF